MQNLDVTYPDTMPNLAKPIQPSSFSEVMREEIMSLFQDPLAADEVVTVVASAYVGEGENNLRLALAMNLANTQWAQAYSCFLVTNESRLLDFYDYLVSVYSHRGMHLLKSSELRELIQGAPASEDQYIKEASEELVKANIKYPTYLDTVIRLTFTMAKRSIKVSCSIGFEFSTDDRPNGRRKAVLFEQVAHSLTV